MGDAQQVHLDGLPAALAAWRANVPATVVFPELPTGAEDSATAAVLAAMADWPEHHAAMGAHRESSADALNAMGTVTNSTLTTTDDSSASTIASVKKA